MSVYTSLFLEQLCSCLSVCLSACLLDGQSRECLPVSNFSYCECPCVFLSVSQSRECLLHACVCVCVCVCVCLHACTYVHLTFPQPGGPQKIIDGTSSACSRVLNKLFLPSTLDCPTYSSRVFGRIRSARGLKSSLVLL